MTNQVISESKLDMKESIARFYALLTHEDYVDITSYVGVYEQHLCKLNKKPKVTKPVFATFLKRVKKDYTNIHHEICKLVNINSNLNDVELMRMAYMVAMNLKFFFSDDDRFDDPQSCWDKDSSLQIVCESELNLSTVDLGYIQERGEEYRNNINLTKKRG